jgi:hypothetical protein
VAWYEGQKAGLGLRRLAEAGGVLERVQHTPLQFPIVHKTVRRALLHRFPYGIFFIHENQLIRCSPSRICVATRASGSLEHRRASDITAHRVLLNNIIREARVLLPNQPLRQANAMSFAHIIRS